MPLDFVSSCSNFIKTNYFITKMPLSWDFPQETSNLLAIVAVAIKLTIDLSSQHCRVDC